MENKRLQEIKEIFAEAMEQNAADRAAFIEQACKGDVALKEEVEAFLSAAERAGDFLDSPTHDSSPGDTEGLSESPGTKIGPYKLLELIGEGGFGSVFMAEQESPVRRKVALKIIKLGMDTRQVIARFEAERQALAMMEHPNIAKVFEAGATDTGRPYFVMELVRGIPITDYCDQKQLNIRSRVELFIQVCQAIQHAHQKGIIHRDIKPSNVLVTIQDSNAVPKIIDFGIAKATNQRLTEKTLFTEFRHFVGTPAYMSPEQAQISDTDIDTRSDIYSLGVLLYELLTGTTPFDARQLLNAGLVEMQRVIREVEPPKPSTRLSTIDQSTLQTIAGRRRSDVRELSMELRGDPDWIIMCCLEKDRRRRYATASALAADAERYLADEPIHARPPSKIYLVRKFARRHRAAVIGITGILIVVATVAALYVHGIQFAQKRTLAALLLARDAQHSAERQSVVARHAAAISDARYLIQENQLPVALIRATEAYKLGGDWEDGLLLDDIYRHARGEWQLDGQITLADPPLAGVLCVAGDSDYLVISTAQGLRCFDPHNCQQIFSTPDGASASRLVAPREPSSYIASISETTLNVFELPALKKLASRNLSEKISYAEANASEMLLIQRNAICRVVDLKTLEDRGVMNWSNVEGARQNGLPNKGSISPAGRVVLHAGPWTRPPLLWDRAPQKGRESISWLTNVDGNDLKFVDDKRLATWFSRSPDAIEDGTVSVYLVDENAEKFQANLPSRDIKGQDHFEVWPQGDSIGVGFAGELGCGTRFVPSYDPAKTFRFTSLWPFADDPPESLDVRGSRGLLALRNGSTVRVFDRLGSSWTNRGSDVTDFCTACSATGLLSIPGYEPILNFQPFKATDANRTFQIQWLAGDQWRTWTMVSTADATTVVVVAEQLPRGEYPVMGANYGPLRAVVYHPGDLSRAPAVWPIAAQFPLEAPPSTGPWMRRVAGLSPDGKVLLYGAEGNFAVRYSVPDGKKLSEVVLARPLARSADATLVAGSTADGKVRVIDISSGRVTIIASALFGAKAINFSTDNSQLIVSGLGQIDRFNLPGGTNAGSLKTDLISLAWPAAGKGDRFLAYRPDPIGIGGNVVVADTTDGHDVSIINLTSNITSPDSFFSPSGRELGCRLDRWHAEVFHDLAPTDLVAALRQGTITNERPPITLPALAAGPQEISTPPMQGHLASGVFDAGDPGMLAPHLAKEIVAEGIIRQISWTYSHNAANLLFASSTDDKLLIWIPSGELDEFEKVFGKDFDPDLLGKRIRIRGVVNRYGGKKPEWQEYFQITLENARQFQIVEPAQSATAPAK
jgi:serine/threonine protein kinase